MSVVIDIACMYESFYEDVTVENISIIGQNIQSSSSNDGKLNFTFKQFTNSTFIEEVNADFEASIGNQIYFLLAMENPISSLHHTVQGSI